MSAIKHHDAARVEGHSCPGGGQSGPLATENARGFWAPTLRREAA